MSELRVHNFSISLDGYGAGPDQGVENPLGVGGEQLHEWIFAPDSDRTPADDRMQARGTEGIGATIMEQGPAVPPRRLRPHPPCARARAHGRRATFHFVTDGIEAAHERARAAAGGAHVRLGGGADTVQQYLRAGLVDELHLVVAPVLGGGERLFENLGTALDGWGCVEFAPSNAVTHVRLRRL